MTSQADRDRQTLSAISTGVWVVAFVVMAVSASTAADLMSKHGMQWRAGLAIGIATDIGLCIGLLGDQTLARLGTKSAWSTRLRWVGLGMSLVFNCTDAIGVGDQLGAVLHGSPVLLLLVLTEAAQDYRMKLAHVTEAAKPAPVGVQRQPAAVPHGERPLQPPSPPAKTVPSKPVAPAIEQARPSNVTPIRATGTKTQKQLVDEWFAAEVGRRGGDPDAVTGPMLAAQFSAPHLAKKITDVRKRYLAANPTAVNQ